MERTTTSEGFPEGSPQPPFEKEFNDQIGVVGEIKELSLDLLHLDDHYQREAKQKRVEIIARNWNWYRFKPLTVAIRDHAYFVIDGQHQFLAAKRRGDIPVLPSYIITKTESQLNEASTFLGINCARLNVSAIQKYYAGLVADEAPYTIVRDVLGETGFSVPRSGNAHQHNEIAAVSTLIEILQHKGDEHLAQCLRFDDIAWSGDPSTTKSTMLRGISLFITKVERYLPEVDFEVVAQKVGRKPVDFFLKKVDDMIKCRSTMARRQINAIAIAKVHDHGRPKLRLSRILIGEDSDD